MLVSQGARLLRLATESDNLGRWMSVFTALRDDLSPEEVQIFPDSVIAVRAGLNKRFRPPLCAVLFS